MSTRDVIQRYFDELGRGGNWESCLADDFDFTSFTSPARQVSGKAAFLEATKRFYSSIKSFELRRLVVEGTSGCAFTTYQLQSPSGGAFRSDVAELFTVRDELICGLAIYFDPTPFPK